MFFGKCGFWKKICRQIWCRKICSGKFGVGNSVSEKLLSENLLSEKSLRPVIYNQKHAYLKRLYETCSIIMKHKWQHKINFAYFAWTFMTKQMKLFDIIWTNTLTETLGIPRYLLNTCHIIDSTGPVRRRSAVMPTLFKRKHKIQYLVCHTHRIGKVFPYRLRLVHIYKAIWHGTSRNAYNTYKVMHIKSYLSVILI